MAPDYVLACISVVDGLSEVFRQQHAVALALEIPLIYLLTKTDAVSVESVTGVIRSIHDLIQASNDNPSVAVFGCPILIPTDDGLQGTHALMEIENEAGIGAAVEMLSKRQHTASPLLKISCVNGQGVF